MSQQAHKQLQTVHNKLISFIWSIADDYLRDVYVRGKYRDVILPMVVLRRLDSLLEPTKEKVLEEVAFQKESDFDEVDEDGLKDASGYVFYNTSKWTLKSLSETVSNSQKILLANLEEYLHGYSDNVKEIIQCFELFAQFEHMAKKEVLERACRGDVMNMALQNAQTQLQQLFALTGAVVTVTTQGAGACQLPVTTNS